MAGRIEDLSEAQKQCLRLYYQRYDAKEIARELGIAPSTVHQRLTGARKILNVARSMEAARLLASDEQGEYEGVLYDAIGIAHTPQNPPLGLAARLPWPLPTKRRPTNDLSFLQKLAAIFGLAAAFMIAFAIYFLAVGALGKIY